MKLKNSGKLFETVDFEFKKVMRIRIQGVICGALCVSLLMVVLALHLLSESNNNNTKEVSSTSFSTIQPPRRQRRGTVTTAKIEEDDEFFSYESSKQDFAFIVDEEDADSGRCVEQDK